MRRQPDQLGKRLDLDSVRSASTQLAFDDLGTPLERVTFVVVDLETTGGAPATHSITEFGAVKVCGGETVGEFATLVNPGVPIPPYITALTGISTGMVMEAPDIAAVMPSFLEFVGQGPDTVLVAHNAKFDVGHLKAAVSGLELAWPKVRVADTLKLARRAFTKDETPNYKLGSLARLCGAAVTPSHRALDDARATVDVLHAILARLGPLGVTHIEDLATASDPVPAARRRKAAMASGLPHTPGVYRFIRPGGDVMYVGTSINVYKRVRQYFTAAENRKRMAEMVDIAESVQATSTATVLEASVLELREITEFDPPYNRRSRHPEKRPWLTLTDEPHPRLKATRGLSFDQMDAALGPFSSLSQAKRVSELVSDFANLRTCTKKLPETPSQGAAACHLLAMGKCAGPCIGAGSDTAAVSCVQDILAGNCDTVWDAQIERLSMLASQERFEQAATERDRLAALMSVAQRTERLLPLLTAREIIATAREKHGWEISVIRYGRLMGTAICEKGEEPPDVAQRLAESCPVLQRPETAGGAAHIEESEILLKWLWRPNTRLLKWDGERPLALARRSPARRQVPRQIPLPALN